MYACRKSRAAYARRAGNRTGFRRFPRTAAALPQNLFLLRLLQSLEHWMQFLSQYLIDLRMLRQKLRIPADDRANLLRARQMLDGVLLELLAIAGAKIAQFVVVKGSYTASHVKYLLRKCVVAQTREENANAILTPPFPIFSP